jgi:hypothetical protein
VGAVMLPVALAAIYAHSLQELAKLVDAIGPDPACSRIRSFVTSKVC